MDRVKKCLDNSCDSRLYYREDNTYILLMKTLSVKQNRSTDHYPEYLITSNKI